MRASGQATLDEAFAAFIVQSSDDAIYQIDGQGRILSWNPGAARISGYHDDDAIGREPDFLFPEHRRGEEADVLRRALGGERSERRQTEFRRVHGLLVPVELTVSPLQDESGQVVGASAIAHDITEQRLAQDYLAESEARLREAQELAGVGMWSWDSGSDVVQFSEQLYGILDADPASFDGSPDGFLACVVPADRARVEAALRDAATQPGAVALECAIGRRDGDTSWVSIRGETVCDSAGAALGVRGIVQDLTERHRAEVAVRAALVREREASEQLRAADRLKDEFLSTVSHELRTPLTAIGGLAAVLVGRPVLDATAPDLIARIQRNADEMRSMVERLLDFSRLEAGRVVLQRVDVDLAAAVHTSARSLESVLAAHALVVDVPSELVMHADSDALAGILGNLLTNAAKFSAAGTTIEVTAEAESIGVVVRVRDEGEGIDPSLGQALFERFFQVQGDQPSGKRGVGIGLSIVKRYAEMHGGRVWFDSEIGRGTTFSCFLPDAGAAIR